MSQAQVGAAGPSPAGEGSAPARADALEGAAAAAPGPLALHVVEDARDFDALEADWNALLERSEASVFQTFEWQRTWWRHFGEGRGGARLHVVVIRDPDGPVAIAPFYVERVRPLGLLALRRLLFVGHRDSDYLDVLVARGREEECVERIAAHLSASDLIDMAVLEETPDTSRSGPLLHGALVRHGWVATRLVEGQCPRTALKKTWEETVAAFPLNYRREIRRRLRNIEKAYRVELELVGAGPDVGPAMREFVAMHQERWSRDGYWGAFADPRFADFHREVAERLSRRGWLFLAFLRANGERCAANYGFAFRDVVSTYLGGARDEGELHRYSPGRVLHARSMQWAIEGGRPVYDFMRGTEHYKYEFDAVDVPNWTVVAYRRRPALTAAAHRVDALAASLGRRVRREVQALGATGRGDGWLSRAMLDHLARGFRRGLRDLAGRIRRRARAEPEGA